MSRSLISAFALLVLHIPASHAWECETDPAKFRFTSDSPSTFNLGEREEVDRAYAALAKHLQPLQRYRAPRIFYSKGFSAIREHDCKAGKCTAMEVLEGLQECGAGGMSRQDACYPLAVVHEGRLYCLLYPGQKDFDPSRPFTPYVPFNNS